jgi:NADP-dependent 3-hydroxy acid dehydrogenase YdfG
MNLSRRIWLTGASSGIGLELTRLLLAEGHCLALSARRAEPLLAFARRYPGRVLALPGDLTDSEQVRAIGAAIESPGARWTA